MRTIFVAVLTAAVVTGCSPSSCNREPEETSRSDPQAECLRNLWLLDRTTEMSALADRLTTADQVEPKTFAQFFDDDSGSTNCPSGGVYSFGVVGTKPECSIHGELPKGSRTGKPEE